MIYNNSLKLTSPKELAKIPNIIAVKDSTGDMTNSEEYIRLTRGCINGMEDFCVLMGRGTLIYAAMHYGAAGAITSCGNVAPRLAVDIYENFKAGKFEAALEAV